MLTTDQGKQRKVKVCPLAYVEPPIRLDLIMRSATVAIRRADGVLKITASVYILYVDPSMGPAAYSSKPAEEEAWLARRLWQGT